jgi:hypothetical protein
LLFVFDIFSHLFDRVLDSSPGSSPGSNPDSYISPLSTVNE